MHISNILIVDDNEGLATTLAIGLQRGLLDEVNVVACHSGPAALAAFEQTPFDILITDLRMPEMSGVALIGQVRQVYPETLVILMTAYGSPTLEVQARQITDAYLSKPFDLPDLVQVVRGLLGKTTLTKNIAPRRILILEDEPYLLRLFQKVLSAAGYIVFAASTLDEGYRHLVTTRFDIFLCDIHIGNETSTHLLLEHQQVFQEQGTRVIILTALRGGIDERFDHLGIDLYLEKPFSMTDLLLLMERLTSPTPAYYLASSATVPKIPAISVPIVK